MLVTTRHFDGPMIRMQFGMVAQAVDDIDEVVRAMELSLSDLNLSLRTKLAEWEGGAFGTYAETEATWNTAASDIKNLLFAIRNAVANAGDRMSLAELNSTNALARRRS